VAGAVVNEATGGERSRREGAGQAEPDGCAAVAAGMAGKQPAQHSLHHCCSAGMQLQRPLGNTPTPTPRPVRWRWRTCGVRVAALHELVLLRGVDDQVLSPAAQVHQVQGSKEEVLGHKVAVAHCIAGTAGAAGGRCDVHCCLVVDTGHARPSPCCDWWDGAAVAMKERPRPLPHSTAGGAAMPHMPRSPASIELGQTRPSKPSSCDRKRRSTPKGLPAKAPAGGEWGEGRRSKRRCSACKHKQHKHALALMHLPRHNRVVTAPNPCRHLTGRQPKPQSQPHLSPRAGCRHGA
jgi:hypothetical protein